MTEEQMNEIDVLDQLTVDNAFELNATYNSDLLKSLQGKIWMYAKEHNINWGLDTLRFAFFKWYNTHNYNEDHTSLRNNYD